MDESRSRERTRDALLAVLTDIEQGMLSDQDAVISDRCLRIIRRAVERARVAPPSRQRFRRWFRATCRHADGSDYSHSQRALFAQTFVAVGRAWYEAGLVPELLPVRNHRRRQLPGIGDPRVYQVLTADQFDRLRRAFLTRLECGESSPDQWAAFCHSAFAFISFGGLAWPGALAHIAELRWEDLRVAAWGYILIRRWGCRFRFYLPPLVCALALAVGRHLPRPRVFGEPTPETPILPPAEESLADSSPDLEDEELGPLARQRQLRIARRRFNAWLVQLCQDAGVPIITVRTLIAASRLALGGVYGSVIAGALLGQTSYAPLADDQLDDVCASYARPFCLPRGAGGLTAFPQPPTRQRESPLGEAAEGGAYLVETFIADVHEACRPLVASDAASRAAAAEALEALADRLLGEFDVAVDGGFSVAFGTAQSSLSAGAALSPGDAERFNVAVLAAWLAHICRTTQRDCDTLRAYRSAGVSLIRQFPGLCWFDLDTEDALEVASLDLAISTRRRLLTVLRRLFTFYEEHLGLVMTGVAWDRINLRRVVEPVRLLRHDEIGHLLGQLLAAADQARREDDHQAVALARNGFLSALLGAFFGLRAGELPHLLLGDMVLDAHRAYLRVWRSKRGRSRVVLAWQVPKEVLALLRGAWERRMVATDGDPSHRFLVDEHGHPVNERAVADTVIKAMDVLGLRGAALEGRSVVFHTLRHIFANRLMVLGVPLRDIARAMGHLDTDTTTGSYLHCFDYLQRRYLAEQPAELEHPGLPAASVGALLGIGRPAIVRLVAERLGIRETDNKWS